MSANHSYTTAALCALINSGNIRLPLSHSRALEVIAILEGDENWNVSSKRADSDLLKARAVVIRKEINSRLIGSHLSIESAKLCLDEALSVEVEPKGVSSSPQESEFEWPSEGQNREVVLSGISFLCHDNFIESGLTRFFRVHGPVVIAAPVAEKATKRSVGAWMADYQTRFPLLFDFGGLIPISGDPNATDNYSPLRTPVTPGERQALAQKLFLDFAGYCGTISSDLAPTLTFLAAAVERVPPAFARDAMLAYLNALKNHETSRPGAHLGREINFMLNPDNREVAGRLLRLAELHGLGSEATRLARFAVEPEFMKQFRKDR